MIKACLFDLDGTILDTLTSLWYCSNASLKKEGLSPLPRDNYRYYCGDGARTQVERYLQDTVKRIVGKGGVKAPDPAFDPARLNPGAYTHDPKDPADFEYYYQSYLTELSKHAAYEVWPFPGITELLETLKQRGIRLGVFSNKPDEAAKEVIRTFFGEALFDEVLGKQDRFPKKPDPAGAFWLLEQFGAEPGETLYFGDTDTDMQTGKNAGMITLGVLWGFRDREELLKNGADALLSAPEEALAFLTEAGNL